MDEGEAIKKAERDVWTALVDGDAAADRALLAEDFLGAYPDGFASREDHCAQLAHGPSVTSYQISEEHIRQLGADHILYAYRASYVRPGTTTPDEMLVSSIWARRDGAWVNIFSQDTPLTGAEVP